MVKVLENAVGANPETFPRENAEIRVDMVNIAIVSLFN
jgi:hypothetical protein